MELFSFLSNMHHSLWSMPMYFWPLLVILYFYLIVWSVLLILLGTPLPFFAISKGIKLKQSPWKLFKTPFTALMTMMISCTAPIVVLPFIPFIKWDKEPTVGGDGGEYSRTIRGNLRPKLANDLLCTIEERLPCGLNEPTAKRWLEKYGKWICSYLWIGIRNQMHGLFFKSGFERQPVFEEGKDYTEQERNNIIYGPNQHVGYWENGNAWRYVAKFSFGIWIVGYQVYKLPDGKHYAVPMYSMKRLNNQ